MPMPDILPPLLLHPSPLGLACRLDTQSSRAGRSTASMAPSRSSAARPQKVYPPCASLPGSPPSPPSYVCKGATAPRVSSTHTALGWRPRSGPWPNPRGRRPGRRRAPPSLQPLPKPTRPAHLAPLNKVDHAAALYQGFGVQAQHVAHGHCAVTPPDVHFATWFGGTDSTAGSGCMPALRQPHGATPHAAQQCVSAMPLAAPLASASGRPEPRGSAFPSSHHPRDRGPFPAKHASPPSCMIMPPPQSGATAIRRK